MSPTLENMENCLKTWHRSRQNLSKHSKFEGRMAQLTGSGHNDEKNRLTLIDRVKLGAHRSAMQLNGLTRNVVRLFDRSI
jgi:hypothetical protein